MVNVRPHVMHESYSHELSSAGFWPGDSCAGAKFHSYAVPEPTGFSRAPVEPTAADYNSHLGEFVLQYGVVRAAEHPDEVLRHFLESAYSAAANLGGWDRMLLEHRPTCECQLPFTQNAHGFTNWTLETTDDARLLPTVRAPEAHAGVGG